MDNLINPTELLNIEQAIDILGITRVTYYEWVKSDKLHPLFIADKPFLGKAEVERIAEQRKIQSI
jgi:predicted site-specific integrase-resolvase